MSQRLRAARLFLAEHPGFYTDGLVEHRGEELHDGMGALHEFVEGLDDLSPQAICDQVLQWRRQQGHLEDDVCLLAARLK